MHGGQPSSPSTSVRSFRNAAKPESNEAAGLFMEAALFLEVLSLPGEAFIVLLPEAFCSVVFILSLLFEPLKPSSFANPALSSSAANKPADIAETLPPDPLWPKLDVPAHLAFLRIIEVTWLISPRISVVSDTSHELRRKDEL